MTHNPEKGSRLSVSEPRRTPPRALSDEEIRVLRLVGDTLIPATADNPAASDVAEFDQRAARAMAILWKQFDQLTALLSDLSTVSQEDMFAMLRDIEKFRNADFYFLSLVVVSAYLYSPQIKERLNYPDPHRDTPGLFDAADELSSGILDPVVERGPIYVPVP